MSCGLDGLSAPLRAFAPFLSGTKIRFEPLCSVGSAYFKPRMGHGLGHPGVQKMGMSKKVANGQRKSPLSGWEAAILWLRGLDLNQ